MEPRLMRFYPARSNKKRGRRCRVPWRLYDVLHIISSPGLPYKSVTSRTFNRVPTCVRPPVPWKIWYVSPDQACCATIDRFAEEAPLITDAAATSPCQVHRLLVCCTLNPA